jgi:hypothetical protein
VRAFDEYPAPSLRTLALVALALGAAFGVRVLAVLAGPPAAAGLLLIVALEARNGGWRKAGARLRRFLAWLSPALLLAYAIMGLLWPWSVLSPLNPLRAAFYFDKFFEKPWKELYEGRLIAVPDMPASYLPHLILLKLPLIMSALAAAGTIASLIAILRRDTEGKRRAALLVLLLAAFLPIVIALVTRPALYNGIRQFLFSVPPLAVLGGLAAGGLLKRAAAHGRAAVTAAVAVFAAGLSIPVYGMAELHPYEYVYFNALAGGVRGAQGQYMLDYWGLAFKQAADALRAKLAGAQPPAGGRWVVAICGPQAAAQQELGPRFETTWEEKKADFAMSLGTFYCRALPAPVMAEVSRDGVVFARVYDLRGQATPNLLTLPPP